MARILLLHTTFPRKSDAIRTARLLVKEKLSACASVYPCESFFVWKGKLCQEKEHALELKIVYGKYRKVERRIKELNPYSLPQIIAIEVKKGSREYLKWAMKG